MPDNNMKMSSSFVELQECLESLEYPVEKNVIRDQVEQAGADEGILVMIDNLPEQEYESPSEVTSNLGTRYISA